MLVFQSPANTFKRIQNFLVGALGNFHSDIGIYLIEKTA